MLLLLLWTYFIQEPLQTKEIKVSSGDTIEVGAGVLTVPMRHGRTGPTVTIPFNHYPTISNKPAAPIFILAGGPGSSGLKQAKGSEMAELIEFYRQFADVITYDQRGTGESLPSLKCSSRVEGVSLDQPFSFEAIHDRFAEIARLCYEELSSQGIDLKAYNTEQSVQDLDQLRQLLGYERITLLGGSYGSHLGLHYMKQFPKNVERAVFYGIEGPDHTYDQPSHIWNALQRIAHFVEESGAYKGKLPKGGLLQAYKDTLARLEKEPVQAEVNHRDKTYKVWITRDLVQMAITRKAGSFSSPEAWPDQILAMYHGDYADIGMAALAMASVRGPNMMKVMMDQASSASPGRLSGIRNDPVRPFLSHLDMDLWGAQKTVQAEELGADFWSSVTADIPVLLLHGTWDTSTPIENAREVAQHLPKGQLVEVVRGRHGALFNIFYGWESAKDLLGKFLSGTEVTFPEKVFLKPPVFSALAENSGDAQVMLWESAKKGKLDKLKDAIKGGADINAIDTRRNRNGRTALQFASWNGHEGCVAYLLSQGAAVNGQNHSGFTAIHHAVENNQKTIVKLLMQHGADPKIPNKKGYVPEQTAQRLGHKHLIPLLSREPNP